MEWVSVKDRLPPESELVLVWNGEDYDFGSVFDGVLITNFRLCVNPTHWSELSEPSEGDDAAIAKDAEKFRWLEDNGVEILRGYPATWKRKDGSTIVADFVLNDKANSTRYWPEGTLSETIENILSRLKETDK